MDAQRSSGPPGEPGLPAAPDGPGGPAGSGLGEQMLASDPVGQFGRWLADAVAAGLPEPTAMVLGTVSADGWPHARTVLLKGHDSGGFTFYTNRTSRKGHDLAAVPRASLLFPWYALRRQVMVEGTVSMMSVPETEPYFHSRPHGSQLGAWASRQSAVIPSRDVLEQRYAELERRWPEGTTVPVPDFWRGYRVTPLLIEFWQGRFNRLHDRLRYRRQGQQWVIERLAP